MKPMSLTSPESIAREYGGNKQKIAQAARMGLVDPTAAVMAGMFIDRMRSAATDEQKPNTTVAQDIFGAPMHQQAQPQPQGAPQPRPQMPQPQMAQGVPGAQMAAAQPQIAPGVEGLPSGEVGEYAGGGIVAFAGGGMTDAEARRLGYNSAAEYEAFQKTRGGNDTSLGEVAPINYFDPNMEVTGGFVQPPSSGFTYPKQGSHKVVDPEEAAFLARENEKIRLENLERDRAYVPRKPTVLPERDTSEMDAIAAEYINRPLRKKSGIASVSDAPTEYGIKDSQAYTGGVDALRAGMSGRPEDRPVVNRDYVSDAPNRFGIDGQTAYTGGVDALRAGMSGRPEVRAEARPADPSANIALQDQPMVDSSGVVSAPDSIPLDLRSVMFQKTNVPIESQDPDIIKAVKNKYGFEKPNEAAIMARAEREAYRMFPQVSQKPVSELIKEENKIREAMGVDENLGKKQIAKFEAERAELKGDREEAKWMRLIEAGFATMAGESPHALVNIGKGASEAMKGFAQDIKELKKADRELNRAEMALESAENQAKVDKSKSVQARVDKQEERRDKADQARATAVGNFFHTMNTGETSTFNALVQERATRFSAEKQFQGHALSAEATKFAHTYDRDEAAIDRRMKADPNLTYQQAFREHYKDKNVREHDRYNAARAAIAKAKALMGQDQGLDMMKNKLATLQTGTDKVGNAAEIAELERKIKAKEQEHYAGADVTQDTLDYIAEEDRRLLSEIKPTKTTTTTNKPPPAATPAVVPPPAAIADLKKNPSATAKAQFDTIFGKGAADKALGIK